MDFGILQFSKRLQGYLTTEPFQVAIELVVIWLVVYMILRFLRGTRGAGVVKGVALMLLITTLSIQIIGQGERFQRLQFLYGNFLTFVSLMLVIVFQPELRRALIRLGEARFFRQGGIRKARVIDELLGSIAYLARNKIGALVAIERQVGLKGLIEAGTPLDAEVTKELLNTLFWPGSALHDLGVVVRGDRIMAAGVQFPLAEGEELPKELGSRHRAALGLSQETDALIVIVSEETGTISLAERGHLQRGLSIEGLRSLLDRGLTTVSIAEKEDQRSEDIRDDAVNNPD